MERQNMLGKVSETSLFSTAFWRYRIWHKECGATNETNGVAWLLTELEKLRGIRKKIDKGTRR